MPSNAGVFSSTSSSSLFAESVSTRSSTKDALLDKVTILGFGSLLSERSAKSTFPNHQTFRLGIVKNYRRDFGRPASIFFERGIANYESKEISSLAAEYCPGSRVICSVFEVSNEIGEFMVLDTATDTRSNTGASASASASADDDDDLNSDSASPVPSMAFREREEEFEIIMVPYEEPENCENNPDIDATTFDDSHSGKAVGILCTRLTDENYIKLWGQQRFDDKYKKYNMDTIWNWPKDSKIRPCGPYLRHCVLASQNMGKECYNSFVDDTVLVDRLTTVRQYLEKYPEVMDTLPPPSLADRYGG
jgi:hypothetical protein